MISVDRIPNDGTYFINGVCQKSELYYLNKYVSCAGTSGNPAYLIINIATSKKTVSNNSWGATGYTNPTVTLDLLVYLDINDTVSFNIPTVNGTTVNYDSNFIIPLKVYN